MELPTNLLEKMALVKRPKIEKHMLIVVVKSIHEEHLSQHLQTNNKHFKIAITLLTGHNGMFDVTNKNIKFIFLSIFEGA